jgi:recombination protein RecR
MSSLPPSLDRVIQAFSKFPGIGQKTAQRLGYYLLDTTKQEVEELADALKNIRHQIKECSRCHNIAEGDLCEICRDPRRDPTTICVVEKVKDVLIFEGMGEYRGLYHVLGGVISPLDGVTADNLHIDDLFERLPEVSELIIATHPSMEGDTTALFIAQKAKTYSIKVTRLARGLPMGTSLEFADEATLANAYTGRVDL